MPDRAASDRSSAEAYVRGDQGHAEHDNETSEGQDADGCPTFRSHLPISPHEAELRGYWKIVGLLFPTNAASLGLIRACDFREVGLHQRHGQLDGRWRDVMVVELLLPHRKRVFTPRQERA